MTTSKHYPLVGEAFNLTRAIADVLDTGVPQLSPERKQHFGIREEWGRFASPSAFRWDNPSPLSPETPHNIRQVFKEVSMIVACMSR
jgi:hypothetical protein